MKRLYIILFLFLISNSYFNLIAQLTQGLAFFPSEDNTIFSESDSSNGKGYYLFTGITNQLNERRALIKFDLSQVQSSDSILFATLQMYMSKTIFNSQEVNLHKISSDWGEGLSNALMEEGMGATAQSGDATWNYSFYNSQMWNNPGGDFENQSSASAQVNNVGQYNWSGDKMISDIRDWVLHPEKNFGWIVILSGSEGNAKRFNSRENPDSPPVLFLQILPGAKGTGINGSLNGKSTLIVYPNPSKGVVYLRDSRNENRLPFIQVFDITGKEMNRQELQVTQNGPGLYQINLLKSGIYLVEVENYFYCKVIIL